MQGVLFLTQRHLRHLAVPLQRQQRVAVPVGRVVAVELAPDADADADADELPLDAIFLCNSQWCYAYNSTAHAYTCIACV